MNWLSQLPQTLQNAAYRAGIEAAWARDDALNVVDWLSNHRFQVSGIEIWLPTDPGPTIPAPYIYTWSASAISTDETNALQQNEEAKLYIQAFQWDPRDTLHHGAVPYFNLTI